MLSINLFNQLQIQNTNPITTNGIWYYAGFNNGSCLEHTSSNAITGLDYNGINIPTSKFQLGTTYNPIVNIQDTVAYTHHYFKYVLPGCTYPMYLCVEIKDTPQMEGFVTNPCNCNTNIEFGLIIGKKDDNLPNYTATYHYSMTGTPALSGSGTYTQTHIADPFIQLPGVVGPIGPTTITAYADHDGCVSNSLPVTINTYSHIATRYAYSYIKDSLVAANPIYTPVQCTVNGINYTINPSGFSTNPPTGQGPMTNGVMLQYVFSFFSYAYAGCPEGFSNVASGECYTVAWGNSCLFPYDLSWATAVINYNNSALTPFENFNSNADDCSFGLMIYNRDVVPTGNTFTWIVKTPAQSGGGYHYMKLNELGTYIQLNKPINFVWTDAGASFRAKSIGQTFDSCDAFAIEQ